MLGPAALILCAATQAAALSQQQTNGKSFAVLLLMIRTANFERAGGSKLGTLVSPKLPQFLTNNPIVNGFPWGRKTSHNSDPYFDGPNTGVVRSYDFTFARGTVAPDGYQKDMILVNGQYPGPMIEANWGDTIQVTVNNQIANPDEGTSMHVHGINQQFTQWEDGVPGISQCPIAPGSSFTTSFKATPYGTTFWHSHFSSQYVDGLWGPVVIHGPESHAYDIDLGPVTLNDYFHREYFDILTDIQGTDLTKVRPASDNNLINGKMNFNCSTADGSNSCVDNAGYSQFRFTSGKRHLLRLINSGAQGIQKFSIDGHNLTVISNDFIPLTPYTTNVVTLGVGQRSEVIVQATGKPNDVYWMRSDLSSGGCTEPSNQPEALAVVYYEHADISKTPSANASKPHVDNTPPCDNDDLSVTVPAYPISAGDPSTTIEMAANVSINATGHLIWTIDDSTIRVDYNSPLFLLAKAGNQTYPQHKGWNVYNTGTNSTIRIVVNNQSPTSHPWHLHGHEMQVLASGSGSWSGSIVRQNNPQRRDVALLPANGYLVVQWESNNPGIWPFHCHIAWHVSGGLYANILEQPEKIKQYPVPSTAYDNCRTWATYTGGHLVDQIDSGL